MMNVLEELIKFADPKQKEFTKKLTPGAHNMLGVKIPKVREIAKQLASENFEQYFGQKKFSYVEELVVCGMVIGYAKLEINQRFKLLDEFVPLIDSWLVCDTTVSTYKFADKNQEETFNYIKKYEHSKNEYELRFYYVMLLAHFVNENYIDIIIYSLKSFKSKHFYARMAVAWLVSVCFVKFRDKTLEFLIKENNLDDFTFNKSISKIRESFRVSDKDKQIILSLKRK